MVFFRPGLGRDILPKVFPGRIGGVVRNVGACRDRTGSSAWASTSASRSQPGATGSTIVRPFPLLSRSRVFTRPGGQAQQSWDLVRSRINGGSVNQRARSSLLGPSQAGIPSASLHTQPPSIPTWKLFRLGLGTGFTTPASAPKFNAPIGSQSRFYHKYYVRRPVYRSGSVPVYSESPFRRWVMSPRFLYQIAILAGLVGAFYVTHLEVVPMTGRKRFNVVSPELEAQFAEAQFDELKRELGDKILSPLDSRVRMCRRILDRLVKSAGLDDQGVKWELFVVDEDVPNAFVIPGGKVFVFTGILPVCKTEGAVAAVLGHELAHTLARHLAERLSLATPLLCINWVASIFLGIPPIFTSWLVEMAFLMPGSRAQESEADYIGLLLMAQACYNPEDAVGLWTRMEQLSGKGGGGSQNPPEFLSTHPSHSNRIAKIVEWMPQAQAVRKESNCEEASGALLEFLNRLGYTRF